jgi:pilus assembly protein CpaE
MIRASALNVLAMSRSAELGDRINPMLAAMDGVRAETRIGDLHSVNGELVGQLERVDVLLVDIDTNDERELRHLGEIIQQRRGRTAILATARDLSAQGVRSLIRQGVDDFIPQPFELPDMQDAIATARAKLQQARAGRQSGQVITVTRAKGGMGASTLAAHLALALCDKRHRRDPEKQVALLDLDLQFGDLSLMLDLKPSGEMVEIIRDPARLDGALLRASMTQHKSGLFVLPAPSELVPLDALPVAAVVRLIELARAEFDFVVIDLPLAAPRWLEAVLQQTDQLLLVSQLNVAAIRQTRRLLDFLKEEGHYELPVSLVLNRYVWRFSERGRLKQAIRALGQPIDHFVPDDARLALEAINRGTPLFELRRRAKLCRALRQVAAASITSMQQHAQAAGSAAQAA